MKQDMGIIVSVDIAIFVLRDRRLHVGLLRRDHDPFAGRYALPGGFVHCDDDVDMADAARRVLREKIGMPSIYLEQLYTFSGAVRDPRGWSVSVCYYALLPADMVNSAGDADFRFVPADECPALPFDHSEIVRTALGRLRGKATYSSLPVFLLPDEFTLGELQDVYESVLGVNLDKASFRKKIEMQGVVKPVPGAMRRGLHRPAQLYRRAEKGLSEFERKI